MHQRFPSYFALLQLDPQRIEGWAGKIHRRRPVHRSSSAVFVPRERSRVPQADGARRGLVESLPTASDSFDTVAQAESSQERAALARSLRIRSVWHECAGSMVLSVQIPKVGSAGEFIFRDWQNAPSQSTTSVEGPQTSGTQHCSKKNEEKQTAAQLDSWAEECEDAGLRVPRVGSTGEFRFA